MREIILDSFQITLWRLFAALYYFTTLLKNTNVREVLFINFEISILCLVIFRGQPVDLDLLTMTGKRQHLISRLHALTMWNYTEFDITFSHKWLFLLSFNYLWHLFSDYYKPFSCPLQHVRPHRPRQMWRIPCGSIQRGLPQPLARTSQPSRGRSVGQTTCSPRWCHMTTVRRLTTSIGPPMPPCWGSYLGLELLYLGGRLLSFLLLPTGFSTYIFSGNLEAFPSAPTSMVVTMALVSYEIFLVGPPTHTHHTNF